mmetsp:Transcript_16183/g.21433  ORF Transcript_16183/g.21433 Transcript_16183/m.21433 type:complete len:659 (-) Transcript_16183:151-2127(-)|eukprot:CAMPEP_0117765720 /NCGR_PEP_ID=MMETSP0947-20121206/20325_1 /TAXON_ID=44440 /ORGANISM="Chattonella subsalsa, Strain CCMP2191" /LENGTH=658 /DNA_ID=CAMNT_0005588519 /DNA_START=86 /DNA_END=2062 /DNA_ORIENTATION=+
MLCCFKKKTQVDPPNSKEAAPTNLPSDTHTEEQGPPNAKNITFTAPGKIDQYDQKGSLNFARDFREFDDNLAIPELKEGISSGKIKITEITGYTYGNGLYFCGLQLTYEIEGAKIKGPEYVINKDWPKTLSLKENEKIVEIGLQHGEITDQLWVRTNLGRTEEWGGKGGIEGIYQIPDDFTLFGFAGKQGYWRAGRSVMNTFGPILIGLGQTSEASNESLAGKVKEWASLKNSELEKSTASTEEARAKEAGEVNSKEDPGDRSVLEILLETCGLPAHGEGVSRKQLLNWGSREPISKWEGVVVNEDGRVRELYLERCGLSNTLPEALGNLTCLEELWMPMNDLEGNFPLSLSNCTNLRTINCHGNLKMNGIIPKEILNIPGLIFYVHNTDLVSLNVSLEVPAFNFHVIVREELLKLDRLIPHEQAYQIKGLMTYLGPERTFTKWFGGTSKHGVRRHEIAFISHRWLEPNLPHPDDKDNTKLNHIKHLLRENEHIKFVWMDFLCVPQARENAAKQMAAINSLPNYIKSCGNVFIMCGEEGESRYSVYSGRGWCRLERLCACIKVFGQDPDDHMYAEQNFEVHTDIFICNKNTLVAEKLDPSQLLAQGDYDPIEGFFFDESDKNKIAPCIELLSEHLLKGGEEHLKDMALTLKNSAEKYM